MGKEIRYRANVGEFVVHNIASGIEKFAEGKGYEAERNKDYRLAHYYWQIADHWKRINKGERYDK